MFDEALLESSPARACVLKKDHYLYATACGAMASIAWSLALRRLSSLTPIRTPALQSLLFGTIVATFVLMLCYVYTESRQFHCGTGTLACVPVIGKDGTIEELKVLRGHLLLVKAALEAVRQWRYRPTLLNGEPVEVVTEITVNFKLAE
jgi:hypothetical protein